MEPQGYSVSAYFGGKNTKEYQDYQAGKKSGKWKDLNDFIAQENDPVKRIMDQTKSQIKEETSFLEKYTKENPFVFDEELAKQSSTAEYDPYYSEMLNDYLGGVELKRESIEDDRSLLSEMRKYDDASASRAYTKAVSQAEEGFAGRGTFFSGNKERALGEANVQNVEGNELRSIEYGAKNRGLDRTNQALELDVSQKTRDVGRDKQTAIEGGVLQRRDEALNQYYTPFEQSYFRAFPSSSGDTLKGYLPSEYLRY